MSTTPRPRPASSRFLVVGFTAASLAVAGVAAGCAGASSSTSMSASPALSRTPDMSAPLLAAPSPDPRVGLKAGLQDAGEAIWNMRKISHTPSPQGFAGITNSDLGFSGTNVIQGNYNGFEIWDIANPSAPRLRSRRSARRRRATCRSIRICSSCPAEAPTARLDCGKDAPRETVSRDRVRGLRIFDITNIDDPKYLTNVQTCRGSHTHTVVHDPRDDKNIYVYISGTSGIRPSEELAALQRQSLGPEQLELPHRGHQDPARASGAGGRRELAARSSPIRRMALRTDCCRRAPTARRRPIRRRIGFARCSIRRA